MQQTEKYKLNLIEKTDTFSPDPLNENMEKVEGALSAETAARAAADEALDQRLQVFEARRMAFGTVPRSKQPKDIDVGFDPKVVLIMSIEGKAYAGMLLTEHPKGLGAEIIPNGFRMPATGGTDASNITFSSAYATFGFLALG